MVRTIEIEGGLSNVITRVREETASFEERWFRGDRGDWPLLPSRFRGQNVDARERRAEDQYRLNRFTSLGLAFIRERPTSEVEWYTLARHFGLQTRLLDWSDKMHVALYFATAPTDLERELYRSRLATGEDLRDRIRSLPPYLWVLEPRRMNDKLHGMDAAVLMSEETFYSPRHNLPRATATRDYIESQVSPGPPLAVAPPRRNSRIVAQAGHFTLHYDDVGLNAVADQEDREWLLRFKLDHEAVCRDLQELGVSQTSVYPSLESLARELNDEPGLLEMMENS